MAAQIRCNATSCMGILAMASSENQFCYLQPFRRRLCEVVLSANKWCKRINQDFTSRFARVLAICREMHPNLVIPKRWKFNMYGEVDMYVDFRRLFFMNEKEPIFQWWGKASQYNNGKIPLPVLRKQQRGTKLEWYGLPYFKVLNFHAAIN